MKIYLTKNLRIILVFLLIITTVVISILLYKNIKYPGFENQNFSIYDSNILSEISYNVFLKPNILYEERSIGKDNLYITEFVDYIDTKFSFRFDGERNTNIYGNYEIIAVAEGYFGEREKYKTIWKKRFTLLPKTRFNVKDKTFSINEEISIKLEEYNEFAKMVIESSKINSSVKLTVLMNVNITAKTDNGIIEEKMSPTMIIPLNTSYFEITGNLSEEKQGDIEETRQVPLPINKNKVIFYGIILGISLVLLVFLLFFTKAKPMLDPLEKSIKKIFKKHGDRLVALNNEIAVTCESYSEVKSIEDLVRIADEIEKPIMYKHSLDYNEISKFYVYDDNQMYIFDLRKTLGNENLDDRRKDKPKDDVNKLKETISKIKSSEPMEKESETKTTESKS